MLNHFTYTFPLRQSSGLLFCDSEYVIQAKRVPDKGAGNVAMNIRTNVYRAKEQGHIHYVKIQSHVVGIPKYEHTDRLARSICNKQSLDIDLGVTLQKGPD